jgi:MerR family transcriptional regulator, light-induced transcriptional regulator
MTSISDFSEDPKYTIKSVATQTGIRPVTLRAWERRHEVLTPHRSDNRYRLYSERDIAILRWIKSRVDNGITISNAIGELRTMTRNGMWPDAVPTGPSIEPLKSATPPAIYANQLYQALIKHDEVRTGDLLREVLSIFDLKTICVDVLTPCLVEIGEAWYRGEIRITTEHFASAYLRGKLLTLLQAYPSRRTAPYILIGGAPTEQHEIGSLMMAVMLRSEGYRVEYLGPDIPIDDLVDYAKFEKPSMIVLSATMESSASELKRMQEKVNRLRPVPVFAYGGRAFVEKPDLRKQIAGIYLGDTLDLALEEVHNLLAIGRKAAARSGQALTV